jgi:hypothetical protein
VLAICRPAIAQPGKSADLQKAETAMRALHYDQARAAVDRALGGGHLSLTEMAALYAISGEIACVLDGEAAGEREFRKLLVIDPHHAPPTRDSPVFRAPFARAQKWVAQAGSLALQGVAVPGGLQVRTVSDPLALVSSARVYVRARAGEPFAPAPMEALKAQISSTEPVDYYVEGIDRLDDVVVVLGSAERPLRLVQPAASAERRRDRLLSATIGTGVISIALLGIGIGLDFAAQSEFDSLKKSCVPCSPSYLHTLHVEEGLSAATYAIGAAGLVATVTMGIVYGVRRHRQHERSAQLQHSPVLRVGDNLDGHALAGAAVLNVE